MPALNGQWRKATASSTNGACVEARVCDDEVQVRDSKAEGRGPVLGFAPDAWAAFVADIHAGRFDL